MHCVCVCFQDEKVRYVRRLIIGLGSSKSDARTGFYTTLVGLLTTIQTDEYPKITDLFALMDAKLEVTGSLQNMKNVSKLKKWIFRMVPFKIMSNFTIENLYHP